jgi:NAD(P)H-hydrate repair Nnr-like enzyme with NAD(P)H-hydrate dehydratase domain
MGDTLAGVAGALLARGTQVYEAAGLAIYFAGLAADRIGRGRPVLPRDVAEALPFVLSEGIPPVDWLSQPDVVFDLAAAR